MKIFIKGFNTCSMRKQNLEHYRRFLKANGHDLVDDAELSDTILLWSCAFREDVLQNSLDGIRHYEKLQKRTIVTGCLPDIDRKRLQETFSGEIVPWKNDEEGLGRIFGTPKAAFRDFNPIFAEPAFCDDAVVFRRENPHADATFHDQFIKLLITEGCPFSCTYCTERLAFPPFRSFPESELAEECGKLVNSTGHKKVILLSDCLGEYGRDTGSDLPSLVRKLSQIHPELKFALNNLHPAHFLKFLPEMRQFIQHGIICHLNLPVQSASDHVLKLMNREYTRSDLAQLFGMLNEVGFSTFDTHLIAGFPGETEGDFEETLQFISEYKPKYVLLSKFYEAPTAPAAQLPHKVPPLTAQKRIDKASRLFKEMNIICNYEGSFLTTERLQRVNAAS